MLAMFLLAATACNRELVRNERDERPLPHEERHERLHHKKVA